VGVFQTCTNNFSPDEYNSFNLAGLIVAIMSHSRLKPNVDAPKTVGVMIFFKNRLRNFLQAANRKIR
jgi:hypothetical protein